MEAIIPRVRYICSKCQSKNIEYFSHCMVVKEGHRCLDCHHEKLSTKQEREQELFQHALQSSRSE